MELASMDDDASEASRVPNILAAEIIVVVAATIAVGLRMFARALRRASFGADDLAIVLALPVAWGVAIATFCMVHYGFGRQGKILPELDMEHFTQSLLAAEILWSTAVPLIKVSIALFYRRIFGEIRYMRHATNIIAAFSVAWGVMFVVVLGLQCQPLSSMWDKSIKNYHCIKQMLFCLIGSAMNVFTDFVLLALPLHAVWKLQMSTQTKLQISVILGLASFACGVSLARLAILLHWQKVVNPTWNYFYPHLFSTIEVHLGIVSACLPTLRPLVQYVLGKTRKSNDASSSTVNGSDQLHLYEKGLSYRFAGDKHISESHVFQTVASSPSKTSVQSGGEQLLNPNDLEFWRSAPQQTWT
ncbi:MAG: hypothetical protein M1822_004934 [Bathelium mastoideum]|nr:MAG: hypothetical protein M1822_004934 [Bathelium mastoideum]